MRNLLFGFMAVVALSITMANGSFAAEEAKSKPSAMVMDEAAMKKMMEIANPNENHKLLESLVGNWTYTVTMKMQPDAPTQQSSGTNINKMIMGGRFLQQEVSGSMDMGGKSQPFNGFGLIGYDNMAQEFKGIWIDDMTTGMMNSVGHYDAKTKIITDKGTFSCLMTGQKNAPFRSELKFIDNDNYGYAMYMMDKDGKEYKSMEILYKRKNK